MEEEEEKQKPAEPSALFLKPVKVETTKKRGGYEKQKSADWVNTQAKVKKLQKEVRIQPLKSVDPYLEESDEEMIDTNIKVGFVWLIDLEICCPETITTTPEE